MKLSKKKELAQKRRWRIRKKVNGTAERPRVAVRFTNKNIHAQCIDDELRSHCSWCCELPILTLRTYCPTWQELKSLDVAVGEQIKAKGYKSIVFDRSGRKVSRVRKSVCRCNTRTRIKILNYHE